MASMAFGFTRPDGREPALNDSTFPAPWMRANASAIWLRFEFSTQTNTTFFTDPSPFVRGCASNNAFSSARSKATTATVSHLFHRAKPLVQKGSHAQVHEPIMDVVILPPRCEDTKVGK